MPLEDLSGASKYINALVETNPVGSTDYGASLDDHIRGMKNVIKNTFPNVDGAVTFTPAEANLLDGVISAVQTFLQASDEAAMRTALAFETGIIDTERTFNQPQMKSRRSTVSSYDGTSIIWDMSTHQILVHEVDTAANWSCQYTNPVAGAEYLLVQKRTGAGVGYTATFTYPGITYKEAGAITAVDSSKAFTTTRLYAVSSTELLAISRENYT